MAWFNKNRPALRVAVYADLRKIEALVFEFKKPLKTSGPQSGSTSSPKEKVRIIKRVLANLSQNSNPLRSARRTHEVLYEIIKGFERVPDEIIISPAPGLAEYSVEEFPLTGVFKTFKKKEDFAKNLEESFPNLVKAGRPADGASAAYLVGLTVNGYAVELPDRQPKSLPAESTADRVCGKYRFSDELKGIKQASVFSLSSLFSEGVAGELEHIKNSLGGLPIKIVPPVVAQKYVLNNVLGTKTAFWIEAEENHTTLVLTRCEDLLKVKTFYLGAGPEEKWKEGLTKSLEDFYVLGPLPETLFLFGERATLPEVRNFFKTPGWLKNFSHTDSLDLKIINAETFFEGDTLGGFLKGPENAALSILITYSLHAQNKL